MADPDRGSSASPARRTLRLRVTPGSFALCVVAVFLAVVARTAFVSAHRQLGWAVASALVAALLLPVADLLDRYVPRWLALLGTMVSLGLVSLAIWGLVVVNLQDGFATLEAQAPRAAAELEERYEVAQEFRLVERVEALIEQFEQPSGGQAVGRAVGTAGTYFVCGILTLFLLVYGPKMLNSGIDQVRDLRRRRRVRAIVTLTLARGRGYVFAALIQMVAVSALIGGLTWLMDLPAPFILGLITGTIGTIPTLGIVVGGLPALLLATGLGGADQGLIVLAALMALQVLEVKVVRRRVDERTVHIGPALPAIVALLGYELYGVGGAFYGAALLVFLIAWLDTIGYDASPAVADDHPSLAGVDPVPGAVEPG